MTTDRMDADPSYIIYKIGIYGWRRVGLYFLVLLIVVLGVVNLGLTIWIMRVQDFSLNGMGKLEITQNGIRLDGSADFVNTLRANDILTQKDAPLSIQSTRQVIINARNGNGEIAAQVDLADDTIKLKGRKLEIVDDTGQSILYADKDILRFNVEKTEFSVPGGLKLDSSIETSKISAGSYKTLTLESLTKTLHLNAAQGIEVTSNANNVNIQSLYDTSIVSKKGKVLLNAKDIRFQNLPISDRSGSTETFSNAREVCICPNGKLFLSPASNANPCQAVSTIC